MTDKPLPPLADLLRPLSARVMPARASHTISGREMTPQQALMAQRQTRRQGLCSKKPASAVDARTVCQGILKKPNGFRILWLRR
ncbi:hypothetical protein [Szabonella alba]|uniref:Uncharacterized protein n=1 Tax=Szabonella alba TaxID=2804194 RepID=A0A8K0VDA3_9RHOB|nr:hypothetical protein [Szabonella alba]MBL4917594.1 hypothetical protein [Szabonella alba]